MRSLMIMTLCAVAIALGSITANAVVPTSMTVQGKLTDASGVPLPAGPKTFTFHIVKIDGSWVWPDFAGEVQSITTGSDGLWVGLLGALKPLNAAAYSDTALYLEVNVDGTTLPFVRLTSGTWAFRVSTIDGATGGEITGPLSVTGNAGLGTTTPQSRLHVVSDASGAPPRLQSSGSSGFAAGLDFYQGATGRGYVGVADSLTSFGHGELLLYGSPGTKTSLWAGGNRCVTIGLNGNVGIGTVPDNNSRLFVRNDADFVASLTPAIYAFSTAPAGAGVVGQANGSSAYGVYGSSTAGLAGRFDGDVDINGTLSKDAGSFKIDHPLDPANKYLSHSFVESPDMMNIYNGNVTLDSKGEAAIALPGWFGALNRDFRYQLTAIGAPGPNLYIAHEVSGNKFSIAGGSNGMKVSWQVTGIRQDAYANAHRIQVEETKTEKERGFYRHPELFSQPEEKQIEWASHPEMMKEMKEQRETAKAGSDEK